MLNVCCLKVGTKYNAEYVNILFDMVRRNLPAGFPGRFVCFTDDATGIDPAIQIKEVPSDLHGWWAKLFLFSEGAFPKGERVLYFDLDTAITGPLDAIAKYDGAFAILKDAYRPNGLQSSVMAWEAARCKNIWNEWLRENKPEPKGGDQEWIERYQSFMWDLWQDLYPNAFKSYKVECRNHIPKGTSVVFFHGNPRPHEVKHGWVPEVWKVGGGSGLEFIVQSNVSDDVARNNAVSALERDCAWVTQEPVKDNAAIIVGGGPSLKDNLFYIRGMKLNGCKIFATGNSYQYLKANGIQPDAHVLLDARPQNIEFVPRETCPKYYASQCDKSLLDAAGADLICWHAHQECYKEHIKSHLSSAVQIGGGSTVGLRAIALAYVLGYRDFRLFGFDSCYADSHHAYQQALNDGEKTLEVKVGGQTYKCAPWMVTQAEEFKEVVSALVSMECTLSVYGEGMIQKVAEEMGKTLHEIDGLYWPEDDQETRKSVMWTISDVHKFVSFCKKRKVAVQAGGNVGVFPKELAKFFDKVVTFEPDQVNWDCLQLNVNEENVLSYNYALGEIEMELAIEHNPFNPGASYLKPGQGVDVVTLDSFNLEDCDLLQLDIEGYELKALKGAEQTIRKYSPVIVLEQKGLGDKYGDSDIDAAEWLSKLGYQKVDAIHRDVVYMRTY